MISLMIIDTSRNFQKECGMHDADKYSKPLQQAHQYLWSKALPNGKIFHLACVSQNRVYHTKDLLQQQNLSLDGIVNCAGVFEEVDFAQFDTKAFEKNFKVNAFAPVYLVSKLATKLNIGASIVNISSTDATTGAYTGFGYSASKAAISNLTLSMANLLAGRKIRVNALAPGWIGDGMQSPAELLRIAASYNPLGRVGAYEEIANIVQFLLSDKSTYVNGTVINVDGGDSAKSYVLEQESNLRSEDSID